MPYPDRRLDDKTWEGIGRQKPYDKLLIDKAKRRARQDLDLADWAKQGHVNKPGSTVEAPRVGHIARETVEELSVEEFVSKYERPNLPVLIDGCAKDWPAMNGAWEPSKLFEKYRHRRFRCGEDDDGYPVKMKLKYFLRYWHECTDDSPMYVFDSMYDDAKTPSAILKDYVVPHYFQEDLFSLVGEHRRPPYRWMLLGPKRSGTGVHIDPLNTSAWNTLLYGRKRWVLFPPHFTRAEVKGRDLVNKDADEDDEPVDYFTNILPRVKDRIKTQMTAARTGAAGPTGSTVSGQVIQYPPRQALHAVTAEDPYGGLVIEFTQYPGETVFVPGGWWHAVMNIDDTIAVTQNFVSTENFGRVWPATRDGRKGMARKWLRALRLARPDLAAQADDMNKGLNWDPVALASAHRKRKEAKFERRKARAIARAEAREKAAAAKRGRAAAAGRADVSSDDESSDSDSSSSSGTSSSGSVTSASSLSSAGLVAAAHGGAAASAVPAMRAPKPAAKAPRGQLGGYQSSSEDEGPAVTAPAVKKKR